MNAKKDEYMRGYSDGFKDGTDIQQEATAFADENRTFQIGRAERAEARAAVLEDDLAGLREYAEWLGSRNWLQRLFNAGVQP